MEGSAPIKIFTEKDMGSRIEHLEAMIMKIDSRLQKIYDVVVGNETFDQEGLIGRIKKLEAESKKINALKNKLIGAFVAGGAVWTALWEVIKFFMNNK